MHSVTEVSHTQVILAPSRELANQIYEEALTFCKYMNIRCFVCVCVYMYMYIYIYIYIYMYIIHIKTRIPSFIYSYVFPPMFVYNPRMFRHVLRLSHVFLK